MAALEDERGQEPSQRRLTAFEHIELVILDVAFDEAQVGNCVPGGEVVQPNNGHADLVPLAGIIDMEARRAGSCSGSPQAELPTLR